MPESASSPLYSQVVSLNSETHAAFTIAPSPEGYRFAKTLQSVLLTSAEFFEAGRQFPIVFTVDASNSIVPVALLGLEQQENLFVDQEGQWQGSYIPAYLRRYPFITTDGAEGQITVCLDEAFDGFNQEGGLPLFEDGEPTQKLKEIQAFLQDYLAQSQNTRQFGAMLSQAGLLRQMDAQANLADGRSFSLQGIMVVDEQKLSQLPDIEIVRLFRSGMLAQIHAHLLSLRNLGHLLELKGKELSGGSSKNQKNKKSKTISE